MEDDIWDFLGVERFPHDFTSIPAAEPHADAEVLGVPDFHMVRSTLLATVPSPEDVLSDYALTRCQIEDFWTEPPGSVSERTGSPIRLGKLNHD